MSGKTVPRTDILLFLAKTLQVEEEWLIGVSDMESDTAISANKNRDLLDKNDASNNIQTTSAEIISRDISNKEERTMREFKKSSKLDNVLYDVKDQLSMKLPVWRKLGHMF